MECQIPGLVGLDSRSCILINSWALYGAWSFVIRRSSSAWSRAFHAITFNGKLLSWILDCWKVSCSIIVLLLLIMMTRSSCTLNSSWWHCLFKQVDERLNDGIILKFKCNNIKCFFHFGGWRDGKLIPCFTICISSHWCCVPRVSGFDKSTTCKYLKVGVHVDVDNHTTVNDGNLFHLGWYPRGTQNHYYN